MCLVIPAEETAKIFGFAQFISAFSLLLLIYTLAGVRYDFRIATAPIPLRRITFYVSGFIGLAALVSDLWFSHHYPIPAFLANHALWQTTLGFMFLVIVITWLWYAFLRPPIFGRYNAFRFTLTMYRYLLEGAESDLPTVATELRRSAYSIVKFAREGRRVRENERDTKPSPAEYANDLLLLIAMRKFCRHIIAAAPGTAIAFFQAMTHQRKYRIPIAQFASNITTEALINRDSILYHEDEGFHSGFFGYIRPFTNALYGDFALVEALTEGNSPLDINLTVRWSFDAQQIEAYTRLVLTTFESALEKGHFHTHSYALYRAFDVIEHSCGDLYKLDEVPQPANSDDITARLRRVVGFINDAIRLLEKIDIQPTRLRRHDEPHKWRDDYYDQLAHLMFEVISQASMVKTKEFIGWHVHYSIVWSQFFSFHDSKVSRIILFKLKRLLYEEVLHLGVAPNFQSAAIFGYCLNVMGFDNQSKKDYRRHQYALQKAVLSWTRKNYLALVERQRYVAKACLVGTITFDSKRKRLVKTYIRGLNLRTPRDYFDLE